MKAAPVQPDHDVDPLAPRRNPILVGHAAAEDALAAAVQAGRLPHAILLGGPRGIGKATLAFRFARWLLAQPQEQAGAPSLFGDRDPVVPTCPADLAIDPEHPVARRIAAGGHADLMTIERGWDPKRKKLRGEIVVDDVGEIATFLHLTSAEGGWRIVIVDSADEMNRNAANALLKILEEPPKRALLLLVCHAPGRLLPTIRSRCRRLDLQPLARETVAQLLVQHRPALEDAEIHGLAILGDGSIGRALELADAGGLALYQKLLRLLQPLPELDVIGLHALADELARADAEDANRTFAELLVDWVQRAVIASAGNDGLIAEIVPGEATVVRRLTAGRQLDRWVDVWENLRGLFQRADSINMDRKQTILDAFFMLAEAAR